MKATRLLIVCALIFLPGILIARNILQLASMELAYEDDLSAKREDRGIHLAIQQRDPGRQVSWRTGNAGEPAISARRHDRR